MRIIVIATIISFIYMTAACVAFAIGFAGRNSGMGHYARGGRSVSRGGWGHTLSQGDKNHDVSRGGTGHESRTKQQQNTMPTAKGDQQSGGPSRRVTPIGVSGTK